MKLFIGIILNFIVLVGMAQDNYDYLRTASKKAKKLYIKADEAFNQNNPEIVFESLYQAIKEDSLFVDAYMLVSDAHIAMKEYDKAIVALQKAIRLAPNSSLDNYYYLGYVYFEKENYLLAIKTLKQFENFVKGNSPLSSKAQKMVKLSNFRMKQIASPVPFNPHNMGKAINSPYDEYLPSFTIDENKLLITRRMIKNPNVEYSYPNSQEDFYESKKINGEWITAYNIGNPINTPLNEGAQCISYDGQYLFYTACERQDGMGSCDLYVSQRVGKGWSESYNLGPMVNSTKWDSQPNFSSDGKTLFFISTRKGGFGGSDIWKTELQNDGRWSKPENLGATINTEEDESSPYMHPDGKTFYFSSRGHLGMGDYDLFYTRIDEKEKWIEPINLGYPINTSGDDNSLIVSSDGKTAYFASSRLQGEGNMDLYYFELYPEVRSDVVTYFKGKVFDDKTKSVLEARFELIDLETRKVVQQSFSDRQTGEFLVPLPVHHNYALNVSKEGYLFYAKNFSLQQLNNDKVFVTDVYLKPIAKDEVVVLDNIFFDIDKFNLRNESVVELDKLVGFLNSNPSVFIEIGGHTDNVGNDLANQILSENRAKSVYEYVISKGVAKERITYKGYGETRPVADNNTPEGRQQNRRTEFKVVKR